MKKRVLIPTLLVGTLLTSGLALAGPFGFGGRCDGHGRGAVSYEEHEERMEHRLEMMSALLDLSESQQAQIEALLQKQWAANQQQREEWQAERDALREQLLAKDFDEAKFRAAALKKAEQKVDRMVEHAKLKREIYQLLSPEQQEKADKLLALRGPGKRHGGRGFGF